MLATNLGEEQPALFDQYAPADSIVIDPHKHGLQPYGCGCILFRDPAVGRFYRHDSPYTYFTSDELHLGEISLECSRAGAAAVALWATQRLSAAGSRWRILSRPHARTGSRPLDLYERLQNDERFLPAFRPELDILVWAMKTDTVQNSSRFGADRCLRRQPSTILIWRCSRSPSSSSPTDLERGKRGEKVTCLRSVLMKPQHPAGRTRFGSAWIRVFRSPIDGRRPPESHAA